MKFLGFFALLLIMSCSHQKIVTPPLAVRAPSPNNSAFEDCHRIDAKLDDVWILLCKKDPHPNRAELYEYSKLYQSMKRLTYQDGVISEFIVKDVDDIYYVSTYDESKEQFVRVLKGQASGTDLYLKKRNQTSFFRKTNLLGTEKNPFWSAELERLYFVHSDSQGSRILSLNDQNHLQTHYKSKNEISFPVIINKDLLWLESNEDAKKVVLLKKTNKKISQVFESASRVPSMKVDSTNSQLLIAFTTGLGTELWGFDPKTLCWQNKFRTQSRWNDFYQISANEFFLGLEKNLDLQNAIAVVNTCEPSPPGLGVEVIK